MTGGKPKNSEPKLKTAVEKEQLQELIDKINLEPGSIYSELSYLEQISKFSESIEQRLKTLYSAKFPKKCNNCGQVFESRKVYIEATKRLLNESTIYDSDFLQEYRNCTCGSTLVILTNDRRDNTEFGVVRRELFDACLAKLAELTGRDPGDLQDEVRTIFRDVIRRAVSEPQFFKSSQTKEPKD